MRKWLAIGIVVIGLGVIAFPFVRNLWEDGRTKALLTQMEAGEAVLMVPVETVQEGEMDSWAESDGLSDFSYADDADILQGQGFEEPRTEEAAVGEIALAGDEQAEVLDVQGLAQKRLVAIGTLRMGDIDLDLPVVEGAGKTELKHAVGHVAGTADFGRVGNCVLAGHRNYTYGSMFNRLDEMAPGMRIELGLRDGTRVVYEVYEVLEVTPGSPEITSFQKDERRLTLVTCTPLGKGTHRLLVRARMAELL